MNNQDLSKDLSENNWLTIADTRIMFDADTQTIRRHIKRIVLLEPDNNQRARKTIIGKDKNEKDIFVYEISFAEANEQWKIIDTPLTTPEDIIEEKLPPLEKLNTLDDTQSDIQKNNIKEEKNNPKEEEYSNKDVLNALVKELDTKNIQLAVKDEQIRMLLISNQQLLPAPKNYQKPGEEPKAEE